MIDLATLLFYNFKGGVGKTTLSVMAADHLSRKGKKVLVVDLDAQASATNFLEKTYKEVTPMRPLVDSLNSGSLKESICNVSDNLDLLPSDWDMAHWNEIAERAPIRERNLILSRLLEPLKGRYDYIIIDVPPTLSTLVNNAVLASDFVVLVFQTQSSSLDGIQHTISYLSQLQRDYQAKFALLGIVLYLVSKRDQADISVAKQAEEIFKDQKDIFFENPIYQRARVKHWATFGITHNAKDVHDRKTHQMYSNVFNEVLKRMR